MPRDPIPQPSATLQPRWLAALRLYLCVSALAHPVWEALQLPLYSIWRTGTDEEIGFAVLHRSAGDMLIAALSLLAALLFVGSPAWPVARFGRVAAGAVLLGLAYTAWSEYLNTGIRDGWTYSELMPVLPPFRIGLSPLVQWIAVPMFGFAITRRALGRSAGVEVGGG